MEVVEIVLFCCAMVALLAKLWLSRGERAACALGVLPEWDGKEKIDCKVELKQA